MEEIIKEFEGQPIKMLVSDGEIKMINMVDVAKALNANVFSLLEDSDTKKFIKMMEEGYERTYKKPVKNRIISVDSSDKIYVHHMIFCRMTFQKKFLKIYDWFYTQETLMAV